MFGSLEGQDLPVIMGPDSQLPAPRPSYPSPSLLLEDSCPIYQCSLFLIPYLSWNLRPYFHSPRTGLEQEEFSLRQLVLDLSHVLWDLRWFLSPH